MKTASSHWRILGRNVARLRNVAELSQERLAERAEVHPRFLQKIEAGQANPSLAVLVRLRSGLGCAWQELLRGVG
ncbi:MAG: helix-turn-helix domain-containing protein [Verrucomicrobiia bacterium]